MKRTLGRLAWPVALASLLLVYLARVQPWMAQWGSTPAERTREFAGAELVPEPVTLETRAITVRAPPATVWAWLGQVGQGRGGFYSYDWLENLVGANIHNANDLHPHLPPPVAGDTIHLTSNDYLGGRVVRYTALPVVASEAGRWFVLRGWGTFAVESLDAGRSRVIIRERIPVMSFWSRAGRALLFEPAHFIMERQMLRGIRDRAEERGNSLPLGGMALLGFASAAAGIAAILSRSTRRAWLLLPVTVALVPLVTSSDVRAAFAGFVIAGLPIVAAYKLRPPTWVTLSALLVLAWTILILAPDAWLVFGWLLGAVAAAGWAVGLASWYSERTERRATAAGY